MLTLASLPVIGLQEDFGGAGGGLMCERADSLTQMCRLFEPTCSGPRGPLNLA